MADRKTNWAACRNCPCPPDAHEAVILRPICVDPPARVLFEGTLGHCLIDGCGCQMWMRENPSHKEMAAAGRDVPAGWELVAIPDPGWRWRTGRQCRYAEAGHRRCEGYAAAELRRGTVRPQWWAYCPDHMYGRWVEGGKVMHWILRECVPGTTQ